MKTNLNQEVQTISSDNSSKSLILFLDDDPMDYELALYSLKDVSGLEFVYVKDIDSFKKVYTPNKFSAIFCDFNLKGADCTEILPLVRNSEPDLPIILISGTIGEEKAIDLIRLGITDFVFKEKLLKLPHILSRALKDSENKKTEKIMQLQIKINEEKFRKILNTIEDVYYQTDIEGNIIIVSPSCYNLLGYRADELIGKKMLLLYENPNDRKRILDLISLKGKTSNHEKDLVKKNGEIVNVSANIGFIFDDEGNPIGMQGIIRDNTEKKKREKELTQSYTELLNIEKINRAAIEGGSPAALYLILLNALNETIGITSSQVYTFNREKQKLFLIGETPEHGLLRLMEEKNGMKLKDVTPVLNQESFYKKIIDERKIFITREKTEILDILAAHFVHDDVKNTVGWFYSILDIKTFGIVPIVSKENVLSLITFYSTRYLEENEKQSIIRFAQQAAIVLEKINVQKNLVKSEESYRTFFEKNQGLLCTHDLNGKILTANNAVAQSLNYKIEELIGTNIQDYLHPSTRGGFQNYIKNIVKEKSAVGQFVLNNKDGEVKTWYFSNYLNDESDEKYVIGTAQDISDRIKVKEERLRSEILQKESEEIKKMADKIELYSNKLKNSIDYAKKLKEGMHINESTFKQVFPHSFIIDFPKDIIGGDFYWLNIKENKIVLAVSDCTGHGVPGSLLAAMGCTMLNNIILTESDINPVQIFDRLSFNWRNAFVFNRKQEYSYDGMEISLCCIDYKNKIIDLAGIGGEIIIIKEGELISYKGSQVELNPRSSYHYQKENIENHKVSYSSGDRLYMFSDGYCDQFSEQHVNEKLSKKRFKKLIQDIQKYSMEEQQKKMVDYFLQWKGGSIQIDDVMVIGVQL